MVGRIMAVQVNKVLVGLPVVGRADLVEAVILLVFPAEFLGAFHKFLQVLTPVKFRPAHFLPA